MPEGKRNNLIIAEKRAPLFVPWLNDEKEEIAFSRTLY